VKVEQRVIHALHVCLLHVSKPSACALRKCCAFACVLVQTHMRIRTCAHRYIRRKLDLSVLAESNTPDIEAAVFLKDLVKVCSIPPHPPPHSSFNNCTTAPLFAHTHTRALTRTHTCTLVAHVLHMLRFRRSAKAR
jgi:hypothetical protein